MSMKRQNIRTISLIVCTFTYLLIGAAIFDALEAETEERQRRMLKDLDAYYRNKYNISNLDWKIMETVMVSYNNNPFLLNKMKAVDSDLHYLVNFPRTNDSSITKPLLRGKNQIFKSVLIVTTAIKMNYWNDSVLKRHSCSCLFSFSFRFFYLILVLLLREVSVFEFL